MSLGSQQLSYSGRSTETDHFDWDAEEGNNIDLDDGNSLTCSACLLPIFLTPFNRDHNKKFPPKFIGHILHPKGVLILHRQHPSTPLDDRLSCTSCGSMCGTMFYKCPDDSNCNFTLDLNCAWPIMHDECSGEFPQKLKGHVLHPKGDLILHHQHPSTPLDARLSCARCGSTCGTIFYKCPDDDSNCNFTLDLKCAWPIRVLHRSHRHRLTVKRRRGCSFTCYACGCVHERPTRDEWVLCYECADCDFQIHQACAILPNAIVSTMNVNVRAMNVGTMNVTIVGLMLISTVLLNHFNTMLIRNAQVPNLLHLPMENEYSSVMASIMKTSYTNDGGGASICDGDDNTTNIDDSKSSLFEKSSLHKHGLILLDADGIVRVCNACIQIIPPFGPYYTCIYNYNGDHNNNNKNSEVSCTDFVLHSSCVRLPTTSYKSTKQQLCLSLKLNTSPINIFECNVCFRPSNGPAYYNNNRPLSDVVCANMPNSITHDAHARTHILFISHLRDPHKKCNCCGKGLSIGLYYKCNSCHNFFIHANCALLPNRVVHKFDRHPLKLVATTKKDGHETGENEQQMLLCEICEMDIDKSCWYYSCTYCDHSFHIRCIPYFDHLSKIKLGYTVRVGCHDCPVASVRALSVDGYRCGDCGEHIRESDKIAFECSKCYFRIHKKCVEKYVSK
ncbi:cysteine/Histidine-rich C1 domain family protein [Striga asiatica]|uniref:Cysteine/Histidine-rich C1 domain family protein n=1 Tax=Striga asiatica TaxID=4170 RepID=A0A5A7PG50_STRAF|nr:cysteine/Histidine-rich C1 domain family protein [Striga asiatica]